MLEEVRDLGVKIRRDASVVLYPFTDYFQGFEKVQGIVDLFGNKTSDVLRNLKVEFYSAHFGYMSVSEEDGHLLISSYHMKTADALILYLDAYHELHHVKQFMDGKKLFLMEFEYVESPIEIEAYLATVKEAKRLGMTEKEIIEYLRVEWVTEEQLNKLVQRMGLSKEN